jgi:membrane glycosyltransferase
MVRIAPFRAHARLPLMPDGRAILSHDQVEAALLSAAGWGVRVLVSEDGSREANPTTLPEFLRRDARWLTGNLQYRHLLARPGFRPMGRWQLLQAILLFTGAPFSLLFLAGAAWAAATDHASPFPAGPAFVLTVAWLAGLYAPKWLGYVQLLTVPGERARYGGLRRILVGITAEKLFTLLLDPVAQVSKTGAMLRVLSGRGAGWPPQDRAATGVPWRVRAARLRASRDAGVAVVVAVYRRASGSDSALCCDGRSALRAMAGPLRGCRDAGGSRGSLQRQDRIGRKPMLAHVIARHMRQSGGEMIRRDGICDGVAGIGVRQCLGDAPP